MPQYRADLQIAAGTGPESQTSFLLPPIGRSVLHGFRGFSVSSDLRRTRQDRIGTDAEFAQFDEECLGETDQRPLGCRVRAPVGIAKPASPRRHNDDYACRGLFQMWDGKPRDVECANEIYLYDLLPIVGIRLFDRSRGT